jgi:hypothetical protein
MFVSLSLSLLVLIFCGDLTSGYTFLTNLQEDRVLKGVHYCPYKITQNQAGWSARQPPQEWLNITFALKTHVQQITSVGLGISYPSAYVMRFSVDYGMGNVLVSINYWLTPWRLWLSWPMEFLCPNISIRYGTHV